MKGHLSTLAFSRKTLCRWSGAPQLRILAFSLFVYLAGAHAFAASMEDTVSDCAQIVRNFSRIPERSIPPLVLRSARGIAVLRVLKGGLLVSGRVGEGVVIARLPSGRLERAFGGYHRWGWIWLPDRRPDDGVRNHPQYASGG